MDATPNRNAEIVRRSLERESFASIGKTFGISRERVRQLFDLNATPDQKAAIAAPIPKPDGKPGDADLPRGEPRHRLHVLLASKTTLTQKEIRAGVRQWLAGEIAGAVTGERVTTRMDLYVADSMRKRLEAECKKRGMDLSEAIRNIIADLERIAKNAPPDPQE